MYFLQKIKRHITEKINKEAGAGLIEAGDITFPPKPEYGDLSLPCFKPSKTMQLTPQEAAEKMIKFFADDPYVKSASILGPYLNFQISDPEFSKAVLMEIECSGKSYGNNKIGGNKKVMVEFSNVNTHKEYHIGHLRNLAFGHAVANLLEKNGYKAIPVSYVNDFGIHVAKTIWAYQEFYKYEKPPKNKGYWLGQMYVKAAEELKNNEVGKKMVGLIMKKIETRKGEEYDLWVKTRRWSIEQFDKIYKEQDVKFKHFFYESEFIDQGKKMVDELLEKGILEKSDGAVIADLEKYGLGVLLFLRSDGTALYPVADLPLALEKFKKYKLDQSIYVVDIRQGQYFKQLFKLIEILGQKKKMLHLGYDVVRLPEGMMSSRLGNVITYEELREQLLERSLAETKARHRDWPHDKLESTAKKIAFGAMKFEMVKVGASAIITFDLDKALQFEGYTSAYLQYTVARISSIIKKAAANIALSKVDFSLLKEKAEEELTLKLASFPEAMAQGGTDHDPSAIAKYLFDLARSFNDYYHQIPVLKAENKSREARLVLIRAVRQVLENGLAVLGIETMEEM